jgi:hypothetical protein
VRGCVGRLPCGIAVSASSVPAFPTEDRLTVVDVKPTKRFTHVKGKCKIQLLENAHAKQRYPVNIKYGVLLLRFDKSALGNVATKVANGQRVIG